jgi:hypothetical protein
MPQLRRLTDDELLAALKRLADERDAALRALDRIDIRDRARRGRIRRRKLRRRYAVRRSVLRCGKTRILR